MLGRIALAVGDVARARAHLILAGKVGATGFVRSFGPDLRLAKEMLARGEREVVVRYLTLAREFWNREDLDEWIAQLRAGRIPAKLVG
jgi:predicted dehydrogenase